MKKVGRIRDCDHEGELQSIRFRSDRIPSEEVKWLAIRMGD